MEYINRCGQDRSWKRTRIDKTIYSSYIEDPLWIQSLYSWLDKARLIFLIRLRHRRRSLSLSLFRNPISGACLLLPSFRFVLYKNRKRAAERAKRSNYGRRVYCYNNTNLQESVVKYKNVNIDIIYLKKNWVPCYPIIQPMELNPVFIIHDSL